MAALPTICLSALRALIPGGARDTTSPSSVHLTSRSSSSNNNNGAQMGGPSPSSSTSVDEHLHYKEADDKWPQVEYTERDYEFAGLQRFGRVSLVALAAASLCYSAPGPAIAFRGGGPYGQEVTRGQDLTGRDFSGQTLIKQDFKAANLTNANLEGALVTGNTSFKNATITGADFTEVG